MREKMLQCKTWALVGATGNKDKFGYKIFRAMKDAGLQVYPVNPGLQEIEGEPCYAALADLPVKPEAVDLVVAPKIGAGILRQCAELGIKKVWFQPGADNAELLELATELEIEFVHDACIMIELRK